jgi:hypothetical protein
LRQFTLIGHVIQPDPKTALMLVVAKTSSRLSPPPRGGGYVVPAAPDPTVASRAGAGGATANGVAGLSYGFHIKQLLKQLHVALKKKFASRQTPFLLLTPATAHNGRRIFPVWRSGCSSTGAMPAPH